NATPLIHLLRNHAVSFQGACRAWVQQLGADNQTSNRATIRREGTMTSSTACPDGTWLKLNSPRVSVVVEAKGLSSRSNVIKNGCRASSFVVTSPSRFLFSDPASLM